MMNYLNKVPGQGNVVELLSRLIISGNIPHAFLFTGVEGCGKELTAVRFVQTLYSSELNPQDADAAIHKIELLSEPYIKYIIPLPRGKGETNDSGPLEKLQKDDLQNLKEEFQNKVENLYFKIKLPRAFTIKINSIRDVKKFLSLNYSDIPYRVVLISDAHLMNESAQNALLKNLEEPPAGVIFILSTPYPDRLRETIRSRCWEIHFSPLNDSDLQNILTEQFNLEKAVAELVTPFANGSVTRAIDLINQDINDFLEKSIVILRYSFGKKYHSALKEFETFSAEQNKQAVILLINTIITWLNDLQKFKIGAGDYSFRNHLVTLEKFNSKFPNIELNDIVIRLDKLASALAYNTNLNLTIMNLIFELAALTNRK